MLFSPSLPHLYTANIVDAAGTSLGESLMCRQVAMWLLVGLTPCFATNKPTFVVDIMTKVDITSKYYYQHH